MRKTLELFLRNPIWANAIIAIVLIFGVISFFSLNKSFFPELESNRIYVTTFYPGASPLEMEEGITIKVEEALKGISDIDKVSSNSSENSAQITVEAYQGSDMDQLLSEVKNAVDGISSFPSGAEKPIVYKQKTNGMASRAAFLSIASKDGNLFELKYATEEIERDLLNSGVISQVTINGYPDLEIAIEVKPEALERYQITSDQILASVRNNNIDISAGAIKSEKEEFLIRTRDKTNKANEIKNIIILSQVTGDYVRIEELADVRFQFAETPIKGYYNGMPNAVIQINKLPSEDLAKISEFVEAYTQKFNEQNKNIQLDILFQFNTMLQQRIDLLMNNGVIGLLLVLLVLGLFLSLRLSLWVAFGIPFSFLGMFIVGAIYGMTINMISLFGMILVVGILVDDGIVIAENIYAHFEKGKSPFKAALDGTLEVGSSVLTSVLTTVIAFSVLFFIEGLEMMAEMAFVVISCLLISLIDAFLILPVHLSTAKVLKKPSDKGAGAKFRKRINGFIENIRDNYYGRLLRWNIKHRKIAIFVPLAFFVGVLALVFSKNIQTTFFPSIPFDDFNVEVAFTPGEREDRTEAYLLEALKAIEEVNQEIITETGDSIITHTTLAVGYTENLGESGGHCGYIKVSLDAEGKSISSFDVADRVRAKVREPKDANKFLIGGGNRWGKPVSVSLTGNDYRELKIAKDLLAKKLKQIAELKDITDNSGLGKREIILELKPQAYALGFNSREISRQIRQGFYGEEAQRLIIGTDEVKIWVRYPLEDRAGIGQFENLKIKNNAGQEFPLNQLTDYRIERGETSIKHFNGNKEILVEADLTDPYFPVPDVLALIKKDAIPELQATYPNIDIQFRGQQENAEKSTSSMKILLLVALFLMGLLITINFSSVYQTIVILSLIPLGIISAIAGHGIENLPVSILSAWGMIALCGIIVNDAVVFLDKYNQNIKAGFTTHEAIYDAGISRFRPIILTSITTVVGLYPLILEKSFQAQFLIPMATSVAYGVLIGTFFILLYFPIIILAFNKVKRSVYQLWYGEIISAEAIEPAYRKLNRTFSEDE